MGIFDKFKKKKPEYDSTNIKITDLNTGFVFDYNLTSWRVVETYIYDWGDNFISKEFKIDNGDDIRFLSVEDDDELTIIISEKVKVRAINEDIPEHITENDKPPKSLNYKDMKFYLEETSPGYFRNTKHKDEDENWVELICWDYFDDNDKFNISIEQWEENRFEASFGKVIQEFEISNILPAE